MCALATTLLAQSTERRFDAVVIKPLGPKGGPAPGVGEVILPGGTFGDPGTTLRALIEEAYGFADLGLTITGLPEWAEAAGYAITGEGRSDRRTRRPA